MADEVTYVTQVSLGDLINVKSRSYTHDQTNKEHDLQTIQATTADQSLTITGLSTNSKRIWVRNTGNVPVNLGPDSASAIEKFMVLYPGIINRFRLKAGVTLRHQCDVGQSYLDLYILDE